MNEHFHRCKNCDLRFGCFCDEAAWAMGHCPTCGSRKSGLNLIGAVVIVAAVVILMLVSRSL